METLHTQTTLSSPYEDKLESPRLRTRFLTGEDADRWREFFTDPHVLKIFPASFIVPGEDHAKIWIERQLDRYCSGAFGLQALIRKGTGEFIGMCGLLRQEVDGRPEVEVGYHILAQYRDKGYASEAARLFIDYAFKNNIAGSLISIIGLANPQSQRVAVKNGLKINRKTSWKGADVFIYQVSKPKRGYANN